MRYIGIILAIGLLLGILALEAVPPADSLSGPAVSTRDSVPASVPDAKQVVRPPVQEAPKGQVDQIMQEFGAMLRWFIYAVIAISIISLARVFYLRRKRGRGGFSDPGRNQPPKNSMNDNRRPDGVPGTEPPKKRMGFSYTYLVVMILLLLLMIHSWNNARNSVSKKDYSEFVAMLKANKIEKVEFVDRDIVYTDRQTNRFQTLMPFDNVALVDSLISRDVKVVTRRPTQWARVLEFLFPMALLGFFFFFILRGMRNQNSQAFSFGRSKARLHQVSKINITFKDVAGVDEAKEELQEIVEFLRDPKRFQVLGGRIPRGVLLVGRPGTGKTLLAKAVSGEAGVPFFTISGSDFVELFVGVGAARVRDLFEQAKKNSPCIVFIDEIDAVGRHRGTGLGGGHDEREQTLNQLLVEMDGFEPNESVIIIAATNRPDILDPALLRPGRFDRQVTVDLPDIKGRTEILVVHAAKVPLSEDVKLELIARGTPGFSGADLANIVNEAALIAARLGKKQIEMQDFEEAKDKLVLGKEKKSRVIPEEDKLATAYHEVGHVLASVFQDKTEPVHKVSIIPRGFSAGATHFLQTDRMGYSRGYLEQLLVELLGGRAAEEVIFGELTTGAGNDLERVTMIAKKMVCSWGMSDKLGPMTIGKEEGDVYLGKELISRNTYSDETTRLVDREIHDFIMKAHQKALNLMQTHRGLLELLAKELYEKETLGTDEIFSMILGNINEELQEVVKTKYQKALELRFEHSEPITAASSEPSVSEKENKE
jgi:cell division protease FtsH